MSANNSERLNRRSFLGWAASGAGGILAGPYVITSTALGAEDRGGCRSAVAWKMQVLPERLCGKEKNQ